MGFKVKKTRKQKIVGTLSLLLFLFIVFCIVYFLTFFFSLASNTHEGEKIIESDWNIVIQDTGYGYNAPQGIVFSFEDNGRFSIKYEDGEKIASGFYKIKLDDGLDKMGASSGKIKLLTVPFTTDFPEEWGMGQLRNDISFKFVYSKKDRDGNIIYKDSDYLIQSDTMEFQTKDEIFTLVREGSEEAEQYKTTIKENTNEGEEE